MRISSIDFFRFIAVLAVICIHTKPFMQDLFPDSSYRLAEYVFNQPPRFAVPFFFMTSGYFLAPKLMVSQGRWLVAAHYCKRLFFILVAWSILYTLLPSDWLALNSASYPQVVAAKVKNLLASPFLLLFEGAKVHLWFLPALICGVALLSLLTARGQSGPLVVVAGLLFLFGLLGGSYRVTPFGLHPPFITRDGPFLSTICLAIGYLLSLRRPNLSAGQALAVAVAGLALHIAESWVLWKTFAIPMHHHDFLIGTVIGAAGLLMFALAVPDFGRPGNLHSLGQYTLGVYLCHYLFVDVFGPLTYLFELHLWQLTFPLLVFWLSVAVTKALSRWRWSKALVA